tara:strand:+ start:3988 stop:4197 length:210 start_codon:yes stop_codon:yes gene_type:complete
MKCKHYRQCDFHDVNSGTCQSRNADGGYCGIYRRYEEVRIAEKQQFKQDIRVLNAEYEGLLGSSDRVFF